jgi:hypothetical protein
MTDATRLISDSFSRWRESPGALSLAGQRGFTSLSFNRPGSNGLGGTPPRFDAWAEGRNGVVAIQSFRLDEVMPRPAGAVARFFDELPDKRRGSPMLAAMKRLAAAADFVQIDAIALIKAYMGLARDGRDATLLYLFWEPDRAKHEREKHRAEVAAFAQAADLPGTRFTAQSFSELWEEWENLAEPDWIAAHAAALRQRHEVS